MNGIARHSSGYTLVKNPDHPTADHHGYVPEHRLVVEGLIGRYIDPTKEDVHHIDHDPANNDPANLMLLTKKAHRRIERGWQKIDGEWWKTCSKCGRFLRVAGNFYKRKSGNNEYCAHCIPCLIEIGRGRPTYKNHRLVCPVCGKVKYVAGKATIYCSKRCHWVVRRGGTS